MPRKSSDPPSLSPPGTAHFVQCAPPSTVRSTVPSVPLAHATLPFTEPTPRSPAVVPDSCIAQGDCAHPPAPSAQAPIAPSKTILFTRIPRSIGLALAPEPEPCRLRQPRFSSEYRSAEKPEPVAFNIAYLR